MKRDIKFIWYESKGRYRFRFVAGNGKILAKSTRGFATKKGLIDACFEVVDNELVADVYKAKDGFRWRCSVVDRILVVSSEAYHNWADCLASSKLVLECTMVEGL